MLVRLDWKIPNKWAQRSQSSYPERVYKPYRGAWTGMHSEGLSHQKNPGTEPSNMFQMKSTANTESPMETSSLVFTKKPPPLDWWRRNILQDMEPPISKWAKIFSGRFKSKISSESLLQVKLLSERNRLWVWNQPMTFFEKKSIYSEVAPSGFFLWDQPSWRLFFCYSRRMLWHNKHCLKQIHQRSHNHEDDSVENELERESLRPRNFPPWDWPKDVLTSVSNRPKSWCHKWCTNTQNPSPLTCESTAPTQEFVQALTCRQLFLAAKAAQNHASG